MKKIGYLGMGIWGYCLATLLASKGYEVTAWSIEDEVIGYLQKKREHPRLPGYFAPPTLTFTTRLEEAIQGQDMVVEAVTSSGLRKVFQEAKKFGKLNVPIVLTSKGIEQNTGLLLSEVLLEILGEEHRAKIGCLSGPSIAEEVAKGLPTSVVCSAYNSEVMSLIHHAFSSHTFRIYPNPDILGVQLGGALKNIIAIACGASDGLGFGDNAKAALMTRGLHEMRKLALLKGGKAETLYGLAGMGDLCVTCLSTLSRNHRFGRMIAEGMTPADAKNKIGMVVEGTYTALSAIQLSKKEGIDLPITQTVYKAIYEGLSPKEGVKMLLQRMTKEEFL